MGITNSLGGYLLISDGWSSLGINCLQWLIIIAKDTTLSLSCTPRYLAKVRRKESCNEAILCQFINTEDLVIVQQSPSGISIGDVINDAGDVIIREEEGGYLASAHTTQG